MIFFVCKVVRNDRKLGFILVGGIDVFMELLGIRAIDFAKYG